MKKALLAALTASLAISLLSAPAFAKAGVKKQTFTGSYTAPGGVYAPYPVGANGATVGPEGVPVSIGGVNFTAASTFKYVTVTVTDKSGMAVPTEIGQDLNKDNQTDPSTIHDFCGATPKPVKIVAGATVFVTVYSGSCDGASGAVASTGSITAVFSSAKA